MNLKRATTVALKTSEYNLSYIPVCMLVKHIIDYLFQYVKRWHEKFENYILHTDITDKTKTQMELDHKRQINIYKFYQRQNVILVLNGFKHIRNVLDECLTGESMTMQVCTKLKCLYRKNRFLSKDLRRLLCRDCWQITFVTLNRLSVKQNPYPPVLNRKNQDGWNTNQN